MDAIDFYQLSFNCFFLVLVIVSFSCESRVVWHMRENGCLDSRHWPWTGIILLFNIFVLSLGLVVHHVNLGWDNVWERFGDKRLSGGYLALAWTLRCWRPAGQWPAVFHQPPTVLCNNTDYIQPGQSCCGFNRRKGVQWRNGEISERTFPKKIDQKIWPSLVVQKM